jgi:hypothetical protein
LTLPGLLSGGQALLRADPAEVSKTLLTYRQAGVLSPNEARAAIGYTVPKAGPR